MKFPASWGPFTRGLVGGVVGILAVLLVLSSIYAGLVLQADHRTLQTIVKMINDAQAKAPSK